MRGADEALDQPEQHRGAELVLDQAGQADRDQEEQHDRERQRDDDRAGPHPAGISWACRVALTDALPVVASSGGQLGVGGDLQRAEADHQRAAERDDAAHDRQPQQAVAAQRRVQREGADLDLAERGLLAASGRRSTQLLGRRLAHRHRPVGDAAHHHALEHRLTADGRVALGVQLAVAALEPARGSTRRRRPADRRDRSRRPARWTSAYCADRGLRRVQAALGHRGAGSARRARRCPSASGGRCRRDGSWSTPRRAAPRWVARVMNSLPHVQRTCACT